MKILKNMIAVSCAALLLLGSGVFPYNYVDFSIPIVANAETTTIDLSTLTSDYTISDSGEYLITGTTTEYRIIVKGSPTITLSDATIDFSGKTGNYDAGTSFTPIDFNSASGMCKVILQGKNVLKASPKQAPGIKVGLNGVTFDGDGSLEVHGGEQWPGIGNSDGKFYIRIDGGTIDAYGGENATGIGNSNCYSGGKIEINGGNITAHGGNHAAGIGGGSYADWSPVQYTITITGGTINAYGGNGGAGIGSGNGGYGGTITISGGKITATGGSGAEDIGHGSGSSNSGNITYNGGIVNGVNYNSSEFIVTIPASVQLGETATIEFSDVYLSSDEEIKVSLSNASGQGNSLALTGDGGAELSYKIKQNDENGNDVNVGDEFFTTAEDSTVSLYFTEPENIPEYSGEYSGSVTFLIKLAPT